MNNSFWWLLILLACGSGCGNCGGCGGGVPVTQPSFNWNNCNCNCNPCDQPVTIPSNPCQPVNNNGCDWLWIIFLIFIFGGTNMNKCGSCTRNTCC